MPHKTNFKIVKARMKFDLYDIIYGDVAQLVRAWDS